MGVKKARKPPLVDPSPSSSLYPGGEAARARFRHQSLLQDYTELLRETEAKKRQLVMTKQKKLKLVAEVKFLRRRFKCLSENPNHTALYRLTKQPLRVSSSLVQDSHLPDRAIESEVSPTHKSTKGTENLTSRRRLAAIDLNKACLPIGEETEEFHVNQEPIKLDKTKFSMEADVNIAGDAKLLICRDGSNAVSSVGKRKITWQDQVALKVQGSKNTSDECGVCYRALVVNGTLQRTTGT